MMEKLNASIADIPRPKRLKWLPISPTGYPVPWFVAWIDGVPDFRVADQEKLGRALRRDLCWLCGQTLGRHKAFVIGPMCAVNRTTAEPPCHRDCAEYALRACPFLTKPRMRRNEQDRPAAIDPPGVMIMRNPGCALLWMTRSYHLTHTHNGPLIKLGEPTEIVPYAEGRIATRAELNASITSGLPLLSSIAAQEGRSAMEALNRQVNAADALLKRLLPHAA
jgi:hypothetical protein